MPVIESETWGTRIVMPGGTINAPPPSRPKRDRDDHEEGGGRSFGVVYANDLARAVLKGEKRAPYPSGSIIVREKLSAADATRPELLAVMIKRARGFNPKAGDWEFLTVDGALTTIQERQKKGTCLECHATQRTLDYVYPLPAPKKQ